jgi:hypothetical protein
VIDLDDFFDQPRYDRSLKQFIEAKGHQHWETYRLLARSAKNGCPLCTFFVSNFEDGHMPSMDPDGKGDFSLHARKHNPNCADELGICEMELHHHGLNPYGSLLCRAGMFVSPGG